MQTFVNFNNQFGKKYDIYDFIACCFLGCSLIFALERTTFLDSAFLFFNLLNKQTFVIEHFRYSAFLSQIPAVIGIKLGLNIGTIAALLSFGYALVHFAIFVLVKHTFKQKTLAMVYLMCQLLAMHEVYFLMVTEAYLALGFGVLYAAILLSTFSFKNKTIWSFIVLTLGIFSHPFFALYFVIITAYTFIFQKQISWWNIGFFGLLLLTKLLMFNATGYEGAYYQQLLNFNSFSGSFLHHYFKGHFFSYYKLMLILMFGVIGVLYQSKLKPQLLTYVLGIIGVYVLLAILSAEGEAIYMLQRTLFVLSFAVLYPLVYVWNNLPNRIILSFAIPIILLMSINTILNTSEKYTKRAAIITEKTQVLKSLSDKILINNQQINTDLMMGTWALPYETALLSKWKNNVPVTLMNNPTINNPQGDLFYQLFDVPTPIENLNQRYFNFSKNAYQTAPASFKLE